MADRPAPAPLVVGRYALHQVLARGGMATVHLARLEGAGGFTRVVAVKRLHPHLADDDEFVTMLLDEAKLATLIRHPNVVQTLDVVALDHELLLVLDYVEGESLVRLLRAQGEARIPLPIVAAVMIGVLEGLHAAHEATDPQGEPLCLVHRDVSPHNILVGVDGIPRVIDFGIAKAVGRGRTTKSGEIKGKLAYMAPEQVRSGKLTRRTDIFSAAIVLWEMLTRRRLFAGNDDGETLFQVLEMPVELPSAVDEEVPPELDVVVARGLARSPEKRFPTARDMAAAIEAAVPPASARQVATWVRLTAREGLEARARLVQELTRGGSISGAGSAAGAPPPSEEPTGTDQRARPTTPEPAARPLALSDSGVRPELVTPPGATNPVHVASGDTARALAVGAGSTSGSGRGRSLWLGGVALAAVAGATSWFLHREASFATASSDTAAASTRPLATAAPTAPIAPIAPIVADPGHATAEATSTAPPVDAPTATAAAPSAEAPAKAADRPRPGAGKRAAPASSKPREALYQRD